MFTEAKANRTAALSPYSHRLLGTEAKGCVLEPTMGNHLPLSEKQKEQSLDICVKVRSPEPFFGPKRIQSGSHEEHQELDCPDHMASHPATKEFKVGSWS